VIRIKVGEAQNSWLNFEETDLRLLTGRQQFFHEDCMIEMGALAMERLATPAYKVIVRQFIMSLV